MITWAAVIAATVVIAALLGQLLRELGRTGLTLVTFFQAMHLGLIMVPFLVFSYSFVGTGSLESISDRNLDAWFEIPTVTTGRALVVALAFNVMLQLVAMIVARRSQRAPSIDGVLRAIHINADRYRLLSITIGGAALAYVVARLLLVGDFPLWTLIDGREIRLRDRGFEYSSNLRVPFVFRSTITRLVISSALPLSWLMMRAHRMATQGDARIFEYVLGLSALVLNFGTLKRSTLVVLMVWGLVYATGFGRIRVRSAALVAATGFLIIAGFSLAYSGAGIDSAATSAFQRIAVEEAMFEWVAIENYGSTLEHLGTGPIEWQIEKLAGGTEPTFSQQWKTISTGSDSRGWAAIGVMGEAWVMGGWAALIGVGLVFSALLAWTDTWFRVLWQSPLLRPSVSGIIVAVGLASTKGLLSQTLTGGIFAFVAALGVTILWAKAPETDQSVAPSETTGNE